jgi:uncharacterized protein
VTNPTPPLDGATRRREGDRPTPASPPSEHSVFPATRDEVAAHFGQGVPLVGMVHLPALPGSPRWGGSMERVLESAARDAEAILEGGMDGVLVENFGDVPFHPGPAPPETLAAMTLAVTTVREVAGDRPVGLNVLRNDARGGLGVAAATGATFLRVNVHTGTMFTDQGTLEGRAHETLRLRSILAPGLLLLADVLVKHATPPQGIDPGLAAGDLRYRGLADILLVSGARTGVATDPARVLAAREAAPDAPVWVGSGLTATNAGRLMERAHGAIVGSSLQREGRAGQGIEVGRVRELVAAVRG